MWSDYHWFFITTYISTYLKILTQKFVLTWLGSYSGLFVISAVSSPMPPLMLTLAVLSLKPSWIPWVMWIQVLLFKFLFDKMFFAMPAMNQNSLIDRLANLPKGPYTRQHWLRTGGQGRWCGFDSILANTWPIDGRTNRVTYRFTCARPIFRHFSRMNLTLCAHQKAKLHYFPLLTSCNWCFWVYGLVFTSPT